MSSEPFIWAAFGLLVIVVAYIDLSMHVDGRYPKRKRLILKVFLDGKEHASDAVWGLTDGLTYWVVKRTLRRMEEEGLLSSRLLGDRCLYALTEHGRFALNSVPPPSTLH